MHRYLFIFIISLGAPVLRAEEARLAEARKAMSEGLPQVAIYKLSQPLPGQTPEDRKAMGLLLAQALVAAGRPQEALYILEKTPEPRDEETSFLLANAYAATGRSESALKLYQNLAETSGSAFRAQAVIGLSRMLTALQKEPQAIEALTNYAKEGQGANVHALELARLQLDAAQPLEAVKTLERLSSLAPEEQKEATYLLARANLKAGNLDQARQQFAAIQNTGQIFGGDIVLTQAEVLMGENDLASAEKILEDFIEANPKNPFLREVFAQLDRVYEMEGAVSPTELKRWSENTVNPERASLSLLYMAKAERRMSKLERSWQSYRKFIAENPRHALANEARLELAASLLSGGLSLEALKALENGEGEKISFLRGEVLASLGHYGEAAYSFLQSVSDENPGEALYNSAVCGMLAGWPMDKNTAVAQLKAKDPKSALLEKLRFSEAIYLASKRDPAAAGQLRKIAEEGTSYSPKARLALAEWEDLQLNASAARREIQLIANASPETQERKDYLEVFLADTGEPAAEAQIALRAEAFLKAYPNSAFEPEVRMKLGEMHFRSGDYLGARGQFDALVTKFPDSPESEKALFLSAQSLARSMDPKAMKEAIDVYEDVVRQGGSLAIRARLAEALLQNSLHQPDEAIGILDSILAGKPDNEMRFMVLMEKGDTQFSMGTKDPQNYRNAIATWTTVAKDPAATSQWRNQALSKMGTAYEKLGETDAALSSYYDVLSTGQQGEPEYFWYYKVGFDAGRLLETQKNLNEAIAVYEKLSAVEGPRAEEAKSLVNKLRLENFIWEN